MLTQDQLPEQPLKEQLTRMKAGMVKPTGGRRNIAGLANVNSNTLDNEVNQRIAQPEQ